MTTERGKISIGIPHMPDRRILDQYIDRIYQSRWLTNHGPLVTELEQRLAQYFGLEDIIVTTNGTLALQIALKVLKVEQEVITSPFSFAATATAAIWEGLTPVYADIDPVGFNLDPAEVERKLSAATGAILPVHVFGVPCDLAGFRALARDAGLPLLYDAAHAFDVTTDGKSLLANGDASIMSFHATKLFHSIEGGVMYFADPERSRLARQLVNFGFAQDGRIATAGLNAKMNEFQAAMGLAMLDSMEEVLDRRNQISMFYRRYLPDGILTLAAQENSSQSYFPILLPNSEAACKLVQRAAENDVTLRRYFYPPLDDATHFPGLNLAVEGSRACCPVASDIAGRIVSLPIGTDMDDGAAAAVCGLVRAVL